MQHLTQAKTTGHFGSTVTRPSSSQNKSNLATPFNGFILSKYILDFGKIVFGRIETLDFTLENISPFPFSFQIRDKLLLNNGFVFSNNTFTHVAPNDSTTVSVDFDIEQRTNHVLGPVEYSVPIVLSNDLAVSIILRSELVMPQLTLSHPRLNFGNIIIGQQLVLTTQIQNENILPVDFSFGEIQYALEGMRDQNPDVNNIFLISKTSGTLPPSSYINISVTFVPNSEKLHDLIIPLTINHNTNEYHISLKGSGTLLKIQFSPNKIVFPPQIPYNEEPPVTTFTITNPCTLR